MSRSLLPHVTMVPRNLRTAWIRSNLLPDWVSTLPAHARAWLLQRAGAALALAAVAANELGAFDDARALSMSEALLAMAPGPAACDDAAALVSDRYAAQFGDDLQLAMKSGKPADDRGRARCVGTGTPNAML